MHSSTDFEATKAHCAFCFETLESSLESRGPPPEWPGSLPWGFFPIFVSWFTGKDLDLRGCIGTFKPDDLRTLLGQYALTSAFHDRRFSPISKKELPTLTCAVSILKCFEDIKDPFGWEIGKHGIQIKFRDPTSGHYSGTYLPEVAQEQGWTQEQALRSLIRKAGFRGTLESVLDSMVVQRYQSSKTKLSYSDYKAKKY